MNTSFTIDLTITLPDGGRLAKQLLNIYFEDMPVDINAAAYKLCGADQAVQAQKFAELIVKRAEVWSSKQGSLNVFARVSVSGDEAAFVEQVMAGYMDGFSGCLRRASSQHFQHSGVRPEIPLQPTEWKAEVSTE
jgi:hypothetical protein